MCRGFNRHQQAFEAVFSALKASCVPQALAHHRQADTYVLQGIQECITSIQVAAEAVASLFWFVYPRVHVMLL
jgi:hypothetical protein